MDYVCRFLGCRFIQGEPEIQDEQETSTDDGLTPVPIESRAAVAGGSGAAPMPYSIVNQSDAPGCIDCGTIMIRNGACYKCPNCGATSGCS
jgi:ribonucleoside-diphosphate reductase alpha chain